MAISAMICDSVATGKERRVLLDELTSKGVRLTAQRRTIVEVIQEADEHLDAASLLEAARQREPGIDRATVYRTIELLKKLRLVDELDLMHLHGGRIEEFVSPLFEQLKSETAEVTGFDVRVTRLEVGGRCRNCSTGAQAGR